MLATWSVRDSRGALIAYGTVRGTTPRDPAEAYDLALRLANAVETNLLEFVGPAEAQPEQLAAAE